MAGTYSQMHIQIVFAVKNHQSSLIKKEHKDEIEKYIAGIIANNNCNGAFTYSRSQIDQVIKYILNQEKHHRKEIFCDEYRDMLRKSQINFDEKYLFD